MLKTCVSNKVQNIPMIPTVPFEFQQFQDHLSLRELYRTYDIDSCFMFRSDSEAFLLLE